MLVGVSRKSMIGALIAQNKQDTPVPPPAARVAGSLAAALWAAHQGAQVLRVHDVKATVDALKVWRALSDAFSQQA
jgi:dihydropteroate synthase